MRIRRAQLALVLAFLAVPVFGFAADIPASDPAPENPIHLVDAIRGKHPRLLFTAADLPALQASAEGAGKPFMEQLEKYLPASHAPKGQTHALNDTDAQRQGFWRAPTIAVAYALNPSKKNFNQAKGMLEWMIKQDHWETGKEEDSGMGAANIAVGAGILYDVLYNQLDPAFREQARQKILLQARRQWYLGHLNGNHAIAYWQGDPQNNHRWHRDAGFAMGVLAIAGDGPGDEYMLSKLHGELDFIAKWLPADGTSHESPSYWVFGSPQLTLAVNASDRCLGTHYLDQPYFRNAPMFRMQTLAPGLQQVFAYGDFGGTGGINSFVFDYTGHDKLADLQAGVMKFYQATTNPDGSNHAFEFGVYSLLWFNPNVTGGSIENLPKDYYFDDLGLAFARDGWASNNVAMMFKCAPYGGYALNEYRRENHMKGINVAHDDPDVNQFQIFADGAMLAHDDGYSEHKETSSHNTILVDGKGQRGDKAATWSQPIPNFDMARLGVMTTWKDTGNIMVAEGEGGGAYAGLNRYRRTAIWVKGSYILLLDDIRAPEAHKITWLVQGKGVDAVDAANGAYALKTGGVTCPFMIVSDSPMNNKIGISTADTRGKSMNLQQLQASVNAKSVRFATVFDPWKHGDLKVALTDQGPDHATVTVMGKGISDTWTIASPPALSYTPTTIKGQRQGGFTIDVGPGDQASIPYRKELPAMEAAR